MSKQRMERTFGTTEISIEVDEDTLFVNAMIERYGLPSNKSPTVH